MEIQAKNFRELKALIEWAGAKWKWQPLPREVKARLSLLYHQYINDFYNSQHRLCVLDTGELIATDYLRVVVGDYGAYVEFHRDQLLVVPKLAVGQEWRVNETYLKTRNLKIKYVWLEYEGIKVYLQRNRVAYADYRPGFYYVSVLDFAPLLKDVPTP